MQTPLLKNLYFYPLLLNLCLWLTGLACGAEPISTPIKPKAEPVQIELEKGATGDTLDRFKYQRASDFRDVVKADAGSVIFKGGPQAKITDQHGNPIPEEVPLGEAVAFSARSSKYATDPATGRPIPGSIIWIIKPAERQSRSYITNDGIDVFIPTGIKPVTLNLLLITVLENQASYQEINVKCGGGAQPPPVVVVPDPKPTPDPKPEPPKPTPVPAPDFKDGKYALAKFTWQECQNLPAATRVADCQAMALGYRSSSKLIQTVPNMFVADFLAKNMENLRNVVPLEIRQRMTPVGAALSQRLDTLAKEQKLLNLQDHKTAWEEIATGFEGVKQ